MIKKRSKMNNIIMWGLIATASVSLASVGFASWVINTMTSTKGDNVNVEIGKVENLAVTAELKAVGAGSATDLKVRFDNDNKNEQVGNGDSQIEDLEFAFEYTLTNSGNLSVGHAVKEVDITFTNISNQINEMVTGNYITSPLSDTKIAIEDKETGTTAATTTENPNHAITYTKNKITIISKFKFGWGSAFNNKNPSSKEVPSGANWQTTLENFVAILGTGAATFTATITPVARY